MLRLAIRSAKRIGRKISLCGQAPSDHPDVVAFLVREGMDSISLNHVAGSGIATALLEGSDPGWPGQCDR